MIGAAERLADAIRPRMTSPPILVGIAGAVAAGKSTLAAAVRGALVPLAVEVVNTDGFLFPNSVLVARGLLMQKGFPDTYDVEHLAAFLAAVRAGVPHVAAPVYSHDVYDVVEGAVHVVDRPDVLIVEGVNALAAAADHLDFRVYVEADEQDLETWYLDRFLALTEAARGDPSSFYASFTAMTVAQVAALAKHVWREVNLVNLREHIAPSRTLADCVVSIGPDHSVCEIRLQAPRAAAEKER